MFNKIKQFKDLHNQAKTLQETLANEQVEIENYGIKLVMDGNQKIISLILPDNLDRAELEAKIPEVFDQALKQIQRVVVQKMQAGGMNFPGI